MEETYEAIGIGDYIRVKIEGKIDHSIEEGRITGKTYRCKGLEQRVTECEVSLVGYKGNPRVMVPYASIKRTPVLEVSLSKDDIKKSLASRKTSDLY